MVSKQQLVTEEIALDFLFETTEDTIFWNKIHAIEFLVDLGYNEDIERTLNELGSQVENIPQKRIGYWRCRVKNEKDNDRKNRYKKNILDTYLNPDSPDIIHAAESLAKLSVSLEKYPQPVFQDSTKNNKLEAYINWSSVYPESPDFQINYSALHKTLQSDNSDCRRLMAYGLKFLRNISREEWKNIAKKTINKQSEYPFSTYLLSGTLSTCPDEERKNRYTTVIKNKLKILAESNDPINKYEAYVALGNFADQEDFNFIEEEFLRLYYSKDVIRLDDNTKDILSAMSYALLKTSKKKKIIHK